MNKITGLFNTQQHTHTHKHIRTNTHFSSLQPASIPLKYRDGDGSLCVDGLCEYKIQPWRHISPPLQSRSAVCRQRAYFRAGGGTGGGIGGGTGEVGKCRKGR